MKEFSPLDSKEKGKIASSMFPPTEDEEKWMNLNYSFRILPHKNNSGGFYVAILRKTGNNEQTFDESTPQEQNLSKVIIPT